MDKKSGLQLWLMWSTNLVIQNKSHMINVLMDLFHFPNQELMKFRKEYLDTIILFYFAWLT